MDAPALAGAEGILVGTAWQSPGSPAFVVVQADSPEGHFTLTGQPVELLRFKAFGSNSGGSGPESAIVEATVSVAQAA